ncbi:MAG: hypothetical protein QG636_373 [Patescibacteria group bacterium]|nr:hypothetical protein [Patescibacteria group bacterium]
MPWKFSLPYFGEGASEEFFELLFKNWKGDGLASGAGIDNECAGREAPGLQYRKDPTLQKVPANGEF